MNLLALTQNALILRRVSAKRFLTLTFEQNLTAYGNFHLLKINFKYRYFSLVFDRMLRKMLRLRKVKQCISIKTKNNNNINLFPTSLVFNTT